MESSKCRRGRGRGRDPLKKNVLSSSRNKRQGKKKITLNTLISIVSGSKICLEWLHNNLFLPKMVFCPMCESKMTLEEDESHMDGYKWVCQRKCCANEPALDVRYSTWFALKEFPLCDILLVTYFWSTQISKQTLMHEMNMSSEVYDNWNTFFIKVCKKIESSTWEDGQPEECILIQGYIRMHCFNVLEQQRTAERLPEENRTKDKTVINI